MHSSFNYIIKLFSLGIHGYVLKDEGMIVLNEAINCVMSGKIFICRLISDAITRMFVRRLFDNSPAMTKTEEKILLLMFDGLTTKEIAHKLEIGYRAVNNHKNKILKKLGISSEAELIKYSLDYFYVSKK